VWLGRRGSGFGERWDWLLRQRRAAVVLLATGGDVAMEMGGDQI
jgi:hypothetical protein